MLLDRLRAHAPAVLCAAAVAALCIGPWRSALAQAAPPSAAASGASGELTPAERAKRDGDKVFHWIMIHGDKPRKTAAVKDDKTAAAAPRVRPAAKPASEATAGGTPAVVEVAASAPVDASPAEPAPDGVVAVPAPANPPVVEVVLPAAPAPAPEAPAPVEDATETLTPVTQVEPKFPVNLLRTMRSGQVQVKFTVMPDGSVADPTVLTSSNARLNPAALAAVTQWRFAPVRKAQQGVVDLGFNNAE